MERCLKAIIVQKMVMAAAMARPMKHTATVGPDPHPIPIGFICQLAMEMLLRLATQHRKMLMTQGESNFPKAM